MNSVPTVNQSDTATGAHWADPSVRLQDRSAFNILSASGAFVGRPSADPLLSVYSYKPAKIEVAPLHETPLAFPVKEPPRFERFGAHSHKSPAIVQVNRKRTGELTAGAEGNKPFEFPRSTHF